MQESVGDGCVIIVNVSAIRSDVILVTGDSLQAIHLSNLSLGDVMEWLELETEWKARKRHELRKKNDVFLEYLAWLWRVCVGKILDHVSEITKGQDQTFPRIWQIGCGLASSMPFHAARIHTRRSLENALGRVISSHTPSVRAQPDQAHSNRSITARSHDRYTYANNSSGK
jgi:hypothetical protein